MAHKPPIAHRSVKPRKHVRKPYMPIISFTYESIYRERDDTYLDPEEIFALVVTEQPSLLIAQGIAELLYELHRRFHTNPDWQFACSPIEYQRWSANRTETVARSRDTAVSFLGFKGKPLPDGPRGGKRHEPNRYHATLDPVTFAKRSIVELDTREELPRVDKLYIWGSEIRRFCHANGIRLRPTAGAVASQFLRDKRFYFVARRKVPTATNSNARARLPGNYYRLFEDENKELEAYYLDQSSAHHNVAAVIRFPNSNHLRAYGRFQTLTDKPGYHRKILSALGLYYVRLSVPHIPPGSFPPPWALKSGEHLAYIYSNELDLLRELKIKIEYVIAAWVSHTQERGLNRYAKWSLETLRDLPDHSRPWSKPLLLSTYGILAATPRIQRIGYAHAIGGEPAIYPAGAGYIPVIERASKKPLEPSYANVIHRGMIEAETRKRSLQLARDLHSHGHRIIAVYADSVFVHTRDADDNNLPMPIPPSGWTIQNVLTRLRFHNPVSFTSDQLTKLPGVPSRDTILRSSFGTRYARGRQIVPVVTGDGKDTR